jgi:hypothetical protein
MKPFWKRTFISGVFLFLIFAQPVFAGPPFNTDDPEPVPFHHWEYYISSVSLYQAKTWSGTMPHFEVNYGLFRNTQVHLLLPLNYEATPHTPTKYGYADTEIGVKYCFLSETDGRPQVGTFPIVLIPTGKNPDFSDGKVKVFVPVWAQKSWDKLTTYGGAGYCFNSGKGNKNSVFAGWEAQYDFSQRLMLGGELYYQSPDAPDAESAMALNVGGSINPSEKFHFIFSVGHSLVHQNFISSYIGVLLTI